MLHIARETGKAKHATNDFDPSTTMTLLTFVCHFCFSIVMDATKTITDPIRLFYFMLNDEQGGRGEVKANQNFLLQARVSRG